jgi:sugar lactone lactonase YvrE
VRAAHLVSLLLLLASCGAGAEDSCATPGNLCEIAGTGERGFNGGDLPALETNLNLITQVRRDADGRVWLADFNNNVLRRIDEDGILRTVAGIGEHELAAVDRPGTQSTLALPMDFDFLPSGDLVLVALHDPRVLRLDSAGVLRLIAGTGSEGDQGDDGAAIDAIFSELAGIAVGPDGALYVSDVKANRVRVIRDGVVSAFAGTGTMGYAGDGGPATVAELASPTGIAVDADGVVFIADAKNHVVRRVGVDGLISTIAGSGVPGFSGDGGAASDASLNEPDGLALADDGTLFVADRNNSRVRAIPPGGIIQTVAGSGGFGHDGGEGLALEADLGLVARISWSPGELFIADQTNNCARVLYLD